jgi:membrane protein required for colicin V production
MNYFDYVLLLPIVYGLYRGFTKGFILELASLLALIVGVYGSMHFSSFTFEYLNGVVEIEPSYLQLASYGLTFLLIVLVITLTGKLLTMLVKMVALGLINRLMGALFGGLKALLILSVLILFFDRMNRQFSIINNEIIEQSKLYEPILAQSQTIYPNILEEFERQKDDLGVE